MKCKYLKEKLKEFFIPIFASRDYKMEYEKLRAEKSAGDKLRDAENLKKAINEHGMGSEVNLNPLVTELSSGREMSDMYLKHPGNDSSEDEEGEEDNFKAGENSELDSNFKNFVIKHKDTQINKAQENAKRNQ